jgi:hypothetical protein
VANFVAKFAENPTFVLVFGHFVETAKWLKAAEFLGSGRGSAW